MQLCTGAPAVARRRLFLLPREGAENSSRQQRGRSGKDELFLVIFQPGPHEEEGAPPASPSLPSSTATCSCCALLRSLARGQTAIRGGVFLQQLNLFRSAVEPQIENIKKTCEHDVVLLKMMEGVMMLRDEAYALLRMAETYSVRGVKVLSSYRPLLLPPAARDLHSFSACRED